MNARRDGQQLNESDAMGGSGSHRRRVVLFKFGAPFVRKQTSFPTLPCGTRSPSLSTRIHAFFDSLLPAHQLTSLSWGRARRKCRVIETEALFTRLTLFALRIQRVRNKLERRKIKGSKNNRWSVNHCKEDKVNDNFSRDVFR